MERGADIEPSGSGDDVGPPEDGLTAGASGRPDDASYDEDDLVEEHDPYGIDDRLEDHLAVLDAARAEGPAPVAGDRTSRRREAEPIPPADEVDVAALDAQKGGDDPLDDADLAPQSLRLSPRASRAPITDRLTRSGGKLRRESAPPPSAAPEAEASPPRRRLGSGTAEPSISPGGLDVVPPRRGAEPPGISPRMTAIFGGLFGMATVASIIALLIQVFPVENQRAMASGVTPPPTATATAAPVEKDKWGPVKRERTLLPAPWRISALKGTHKLVSGSMDRKAFVTVLQEKGVEKAEVYRILKAFDGVRDFDRTGRKDKFTVALDRGTKKVAAFEYEVSGIEIYQARVNDQGLLVGSQLDLKVGEEEYAAAFRIKKDFTKSYTVRGLEKGLVKEINRAFNGRTSTEAFDEKGIIKVAVVEKTRLGAFFGYDHIKVIEYQPPEEGKAPVRAYWFEGDDYKGYVDEKGRRPTNQGWRSPVPGSPVTSNFNPKRMHPILKVVRPHNGTDFGAASGTPVYAAMRGKIAFLGRAGGYGNLIRIDHPGSIQTGYAHLSRFAKGLKQGDAVATRQLIGYVGSTGRSTGPHLHFEAKRNGKYFNALDLKLDALRLLPVGERAAFLAQKRALDEILAGIEVPPEHRPPPPPPPAPTDDEDDDQAVAQNDPDEEDEGDDLSGGDTGDDDSDSEDGGDSSDGGDSDSSDGGGSDSSDSGDSDGSDSGDDDGGSLMGDDLTDIE